MLGDVQQLIAPALGQSSECDAVIRLEILDRVGVAVFGVFGDRVEQLHEFRRHEGGACGHVVSQSCLN